uniref:Uncharacterized protein n=1 Tax=Schizaphis graminum TaxID=13262 RepID=A0A2S2P704_SCHGA
MLTCTNPPRIPFSYINKQLSFCLCTSNTYARYIPPSLLSNSNKLIYVIFYTGDSFYIVIIMSDIESSDKLDKIIKSINEIKVTQNKLIASVNSFREDKKLLDKKFADIDGKLDNITRQFDVILANNVSLNTKINQLESKVSQLEAGCSNSSSLNQEQTLAEISDRHSRSRNIILFNIPESATQSNLDDKNTISSIFQQIGVLVEPINCLRLGKLSNNCRPLRATLPNQHDVFDVLKNKRKLSDLANFKNISISSDKTLLQRKHLKNLFDELNSRKTAGETNLFIKYINGLPVISKN